MEFTKAGFNQWSAIGQNNRSYTIAKKINHKEIFFGVMPEAFLYSTSNQVGVRSGICTTFEGAVNSCEDAEKGAIQYEAWKIEDAKRRLEHPEEFEPKFIDPEEFDYFERVSRKSLCCNEHMQSLVYIDNFGELEYYRVPEEQITRWTRSKHDEGTLYRCQKCGKFEYYSDSEEWEQEDPEEFKKCSNELIQAFAKMVR